MTQFFGAVISPHGKMLYDKTMTIRFDPGDPADTDGEAMRVRV